MEFNDLQSALPMSLLEAGYGSGDGQSGSEISGAVSDVTPPGASRLQVSQLQERSATTQRLHRTAALTSGGDPIGCCLNERWGCGHCRPCPPPLPPFPSSCPVACLVPDARACPFPPLPVCPVPPVRTPLSSHSAAPAPACPRLLLPSSFLRTSGRMDFMAAAGTMNAVGCPWSPSPAILLSSPALRLTPRGFCQPTTCPACRSPPG